MAGNAKKEGLQRMHYIWQAMLRKKVYRECTTCGRQCCERFTNNALHVSGNAEKGGLQTMHYTCRAMLLPGQSLSSRETIGEQEDNGLCITYHRIKNVRPATTGLSTIPIWFQLHGIRQNTTLDYHSCVLHPGVNGAP